MDEQADQPPRVAPRFDIRTLLWVTAVIASSVTTFSPHGGWLVGCVFLFWWVAFAFKRSWVRGLQWCLALVVLGFLLLPAVQVPRGHPYPPGCPHNLRGLAVALYTYSVSRGALPDVGDREGPLTLRNNWRVALMPFIELQPVYAQLQLDERWDSEANAIHVNQNLAVFECGEMPGTLLSPGMTSYYAVVDERTLWRPSKPRSLHRKEDVPDGLANTVMLIEGPATVPWAKPEDLSFDEAVELLTSPIDPRQGNLHAIDRGFFYLPTPVRHIAWADASVTQIEAPLSEKRARAILTADGGEPIEDYERRVYLKPRLDYGRCLGLATFVLATLAPAPRLIARRRRGKV